MSILLRNRIPTWVFVCVSLISSKKAPKNNIWKRYNKPVLSILGSTGWHTFNR